MEPIPPPTPAEQALIDKLSNRELDLLRERAKKEAMRKCDDVVREFVECSRPRFISTIWACRSALQEMNDCVLKKYVFKIIIIHKTHFLTYFIATHLQNLIKLSYCTLDQKIKL